MVKKLKGKKGLEKRLPADTILSERPEKIGTRTAGAIGHILTQLWDDKVDREVNILMLAF